MDYGKVLGRAWEITWRWKVLWILGFLAALGKGYGGGSSNVTYSTDSSDWTVTVPGYKVPTELIAVLVALGCLALLAAIAIWVVSVIARGGLIAGVHQVEEEGSTSFGQAWRVGVSRFWTLFGIGILAALPFIILMVIGLVVSVAVIVGGVTLSTVSEGTVGAMVISALCCGGALCCGAIILGIILEQIRIYAERAAVLEGLGWIDAFVRGWDVLKENLGPTIILWIIFFVIGLVLVGLVMGILLVMFVPFLAVVVNPDSIAWLIPFLCCGGLLALIVGAVVGAIIETWTSATWTLAYRELTGLAAEPVVEPVAE